jgi:hypothetical protein
MTEPPTSDPASAAPPERQKVVFVMGSGHSGSTILGVALGNCANVFYAGELDNWLTRSGVSVLGGPERTRFWNAVREDVEGADALFGGDAQLYLERSSAALRVNKTGFRRRLRKRYRPVTEALYRAIAREAKASYVVDTAHFPLRARELQGLDGIELYLVFLIRDPQAVVSSFIRYINRHDLAERRLRILSTNADLWLTHLLSVFVFLRQRRDRRMILRHEDFLADPEGVLRRILARVESPAAIPDLTALDTGFPIQGNRLIRADVVALEGKTVEHKRSSRITALLQLPWEAVFARLEAMENGGAAR